MAALFGLPPVTTQCVAPGVIGLIGFKMGITGRNGNLAAAGLPSWYGGVPTMVALG